MSIEVICPSCETSHKFKDESAGKKLKCKGCQTLIPIPAAAAAVEADPWDNLDENDGAEELPPVVRKPAAKKKTKKSAASSRDDEQMANDRAESAKNGGIYLMIIGAISTVVPFFGLQLKALGDYGYLTPVVGVFMIMLGAFLFGASHSRILTKVLALGTKGLLWAVIGFMGLILVGAVVLVIGIYAFGQ